MARRSVLFVAAIGVVVAGPLTGWSRSARQRKRALAVLKSVGLEVAAAKRPESADAHAA